MSDLAVIFGGPSPEHDISILTGLQAVRELERSGSSPLALYWAKNGDWHLVPASVEAGDFVSGMPAGAQPVRFVASTGGGFVAGKPGLLGKERALEIDVAVLCLHGGPGEDGTLQGALDLAGIRYTGPDAPGAALGMDKLAFGGVVSSLGIQLLPRVALEQGMAPQFEGPFIVKPRFGGSSIGVEVVEDLETAIALLSSSQHLRDGAVIEPYRAASYDLNVSIRSYPQIELSAIERPLRATGSTPILNYADKYVGGEGMVSAPRELPAKIDAALEKTIRDAAMRLATAVRVRGIARIDFLFDDGELYLNEINTIPGSLSKYLWVEPQRSFSTLLEDMIREARERPTHHYTSQGADGTALRSAGSIASKLD